MATPRRSTAERRSEIADAALKIIGTRGISSLTVSSLAAELGLTGGALYRHFASTDAILEAVAARADELLDASLPDPALPPVEALRRFIEARSRAVGSHTGLARLLLSDQVALALPEPAVERLREAVKRTRGAIVRLLADGQANGAFRADLEPEDLAPIVMATTQMVALQRSGPLLPRTATTPTRITDTLLAMLAPPATKTGRGS